MQLEAMVEERACPGSALVPSAGFGVPPKRTSLAASALENVNELRGDAGGESAKAGRRDQHSGRVCYPEDAQDRRRAGSATRNSSTSPTASPFRWMRFFQTRSGELCGESSRPVPTRSAEARFIRTPGANLRRERTVRGLTQERLAELADLNPRTVQKIEAGDITIPVPTLLRLRTALGCEWKRLLG